MINSQFQRKLESVKPEEDVDKNVHFALVIEDDPHRAIGMMRYIGHRFFYDADEVEPISFTVSPGD